MREPWVKGEVWNPRCITVTYNRDTKAKTTITSTISLYERKKCSRFNKIMSKNFYSNNCATKFWRDRLFSNVFSLLARFCVCVRERGRNSRHLWNCVPVRFIYSAFGFGSYSSNGADGLLAVFLIWLVQRQVPKSVVIGHGRIASVELNIRGLAAISREPPLVFFTSKYRSTAS